MLNTINIILDLFLLFAIFFLLNKYKKEKEKTNQLASKLNILESNYDFHKDFEYLDKIIDEKCSYCYNLELKPKQQSERMLNDDFLNASATKVYISVNECLTEDYKKKLTHYNPNIDDYIAEKIFLTLLMLTVEVNKHIVSRIL